MLVHRLARRIIRVWKEKEIEEQTRRLAQFGIGSRIDYPSIISNHDQIKIGDNVVLLSNSRIQTFPEKVRDKDILIEIGDHTMAGFRFTILAGANVKIGKNVIIASDVTITSENHGINPENSIPYMDQELTCAPIEIGDNVWIGDKVTILPGVKIGNGSVIGANSVVTKDVQEYTVVVGAPAKAIKRYDFNKHMWGGYCVIRYPEMQIDIANAA